jgi:hypothetical protein
VEGASAGFSRIGIGAAAAAAAMGASGAVIGAAAGYDGDRGPCSGVASRIEETTLRAFAGICGLCGLSAWASRLACPNPR